MNSSCSFSGASMEPSLRSADIQVEGAFSRYATRSPVKNKPGTKRTMDESGMNSSPRRRKPLKPHLLLSVRAIFNSKRQAPVSSHESGDHLSPSARGLFPLLKKQRPVRTIPGRSEERRVEKE